MGLNEKVAVEFQRSLEKIENGKKGFQLITCGPKGHLYYSNGFSESITTAISCVWNSAGVISYHEMTEGKALPDDGEFTAIIKKRRKLLLADKNVGYFSSGTTDTGSADVTRALLYFQCNDIATFIVASSDTSEVHLVDYPQDSDVDPFQVVLLDLLSHIPAIVQGEEVKDNGRSEVKRNT